MKPIKKPNSPKPNSPKSPKQEKMVKRANLKSQWKILKPKVENFS